MESSGVGSRLVMEVVCRHGVRGTGWVASVHVSSVCVHEKKYVAAVTDRATITVLLLRTGTKSPKNTPFSKTFSVGKT